jgi:hypothetical protein
MYNILECNPFRWRRVMYGVNGELLTENIWKTD